RTILSIHSSLICRFPLLPCFFQCYGAHRDLHSFPTRRSSDLFAEIGAGQETASLFFKAGGASGTIAKTMSAYDMTFSDAIYGPEDRKSTRLNSSHVKISYAVFCLKKKNRTQTTHIPTTPITRL